MSSSNVTKEEINYATGEVEITKDIGDLVTCNLSSLVLNRVVSDNVLERVVKIQMRALDNVISLGRVPVPQAEYTNQKYRAVGSGEQGIASLLAIENIMWDSEKAVDYIAELEEKIMYYTIKTSSELGAEKGNYEVFEGSEWNTGEWFDKRQDKFKLDWTDVKQMAGKNMRNAYLRAIAP